jgi:hypothetical protein
LQGSYLSKTVDRERISLQLSLFVPGNRTNARLRFA